MSAYNYYTANNTGNLIWANGTISSTNDDLYVTLSDDDFASYNNKQIELIRIDENMNVSVHKSLVKAIMEKIMEDEKLKESIYNMVMDLVIQKNKKPKITNKDIKKVFDE